MNNFSGVQFASSQDRVVRQIVTTVKKKEFTQSHFEELIQDNERMRLIVFIFSTINRDVIDELTGQLDMYKSQSNSNEIQIIKQELTSKTYQLDQVLIELNQFREQARQPNKEVFQLTESYEKQIAECKIQYQSIQDQFEKLKLSFDEQAKQLRYFSSKTRLLEIEQDKAKNEITKFQSVQATQVSIEEMQNQLEETKSEVELWRSKFEKINIQYQTILTRDMNSLAQVEIIRLNSIIEGLYHEIQVWKERYQALEQRFDSRSEIKKYELMIADLRNQISIYEQQLSELRGNLKSIQSSYQNRTSVEMQEYQQQFQNEREEMSQHIQSLETELDELRRQQNQWLVEQESRSLKMEVYGEDQFRQKEQQVSEYEAIIREMEGDIAVLINQVQVLKGSSSQNIMTNNSQVYANPNLLMTDKSNDRIKILEEQLQEERTKVSKFMAKIQSAQEIQSQVETYQQEIEVWKNRYFQTELRLKDFDQMKRDYESFSIQIEEYQSQIQSYKFQIEENNSKLQQINQSSQFSQKEINEQRIKFQNEIKELNETIKGYDREIGKLKEKFSLEYNQMIDQKDQLKNELKQMEVQTERRIQQESQRWKQQFQNESNEFKSKIYSLESANQQLVALKWGGLFILQFQQTQYNELKVKQKNEMNDQKEQLIKQIREREQVISELNKEIDGLKYTLNAKDSEYQRKMGDLQLKLKKHHEENKQVGAEMMRMKQKMQEYEEEIKSRTKSLNDLQYSLQSVTQQTEYKSRQLDQVQMDGKKQILIIQEEMKIRELKIVELERIMKQQKFDIEKLMKLRMEQDLKIQKMITTVKIKKNLKIRLPNMNPLSMF